MCGSLRTETCSVESGMLYKYIETIQQCQTILSSAKGEMNLLSIFHDSCPYFIMTSMKRIFRINFTIEGGHKWQKDSIDNNKIIIFYFILLNTRYHHNLIMRTAKMNVENGKSSAAHKQKY